MNPNKRGADFDLLLFYLQYGNNCDDQCLKIDMNLYFI